MPALNSRYLGSDEAIAKQQNAIAESTNATLSATDRIGKSVSAGIGAVIQGQDSLSKLELQRQEALARANQGSAIGQFAEAAGKAVVAYENNAYNNEVDKQKRAQSAAAAAAAAAKETAATKEKADKLQSEREFGTAADELGTLHQTYLQDNWNNGSLNFKAQASKLIAKYPGLSPAQVNDLIDRTNKVVTDYGTDKYTKLQAGVELETNKKAETTGNAFLLGLKPDVEYIRKLAPTTQAKPYLEGISKRLEDFVRSDNGMTDAQKYEFVNRAITDLQGAYGDKSAAFAEFDASTRALKQWAVGSSQAYADYTTSKSTYAEYKNAIAVLEITTGKDFSKKMVAPGEQEKLRSDLVDSLTTVTRAQESAQQKAGLNFNLGDDVVNGVAAGVIVSPDLETAIAANPLLANNPNIKQALEIGKQLREAQNDLATLGIDQAGANKTIAELDLTDAKGVVALTKTILAKQSSGQTLNAKEQLTTVLLDQLARQNPQVGASLQQLAASTQAGGGAFSAAEVAQLQQGLRTESAGIQRVKQAVAEEYARKFEAVQTKHARVVQRFGKIPTNAELAEYYKQATPNIQTTIQQLQTTVNEAGASVSSPYGQQSNFSTAGGNMAVSRQPDGRYTVAPRSALQVQTKSADGGAPFLTPVQAGVTAPHTFNRGYMGGGYKAGRDKGRQHAGIDFPLSAGQKAMTLVGGTVVAVKNDKGYGGYIDFRGDNGFVYRYAHQRPFVQVGQRLGAGEAVGTPNGSGAGAAHLHFEVREASAYASSPYGISGTVDPVAHLRNLTSLAGTNQGNNAGNVRGQATAAVRNYMPQAKANNNSIFTNGGGVLQAGLFQQISRQTQPASQAFNSQRPLTMGGGASYVAGTPSYNTNDDMGYAYLRNNPNVRTAMHGAAKALGVPTEWLADIAAQESGNFELATKVHPGAVNRNFGLFGFGKDSGVPGFDRLSPEQQVNAYVSYMKTNGWDKVRSSLGGNVTLAQLWAVTRMGVNWRKQILNGRDPQSLRLNDTSKTYADELRLLGNHVGRAYDVPGGARSGRAKRNSAVRKRADTGLGQAIAANNSYDIHTREG